ncbi:MAG: retropepsin-like aspartic protease [Bacteroidales bacterium]|nr:retropepsin-like aspartic protease [Bacteroidales bacterium]
MPTYIPIETVPIEDDGYHLVVPMEVNGIAARMLVDTGASRSVFDGGRLKRFFPGGAPELEVNLQKSTGLGARDMTSQALFLDTISIGELIIRNYPAVVLEMNHVNLSYEELGLPPIDGVLGSDILMKYGARIDYKKKEMRINLRKVRK